MEPTSERVLADINVLDKIIANKGTVVHGEALRHGVRAKQHQGSGTARLRSHQRKDTQMIRSIHPDALACVDENDMDLEATLAKCEHTMLLQQVEDDLDMSLR
jgi:hypothetical protein